MALGGAALALTLLRPSPVRTLDQAVAVPEPLLLDRVNQLAAENRDLRERLDALELRPVSSARVAVSPDAASSEDLDALRAELLAALTERDAGTTDGAADPARFRERVAAAIEELEHEEGVEKWLSRLAAERSTIETVMPRLAEDLGITSDQAERLASVLHAKVAREEDQARLWRDRVDKEVLADRARADKETFVDELGQVLTPDQVERYFANPIHPGGVYIGATVRKR
ncbi:hypothetical protein Pla86_18090 [Planctomycetes bacterium Pla86]|uniref:Uncharacterized protein n=2 Tax=Engelhardtia mirabilis TaxID=2528011 RepID=A0A518BIE7_9BACT|nr:hypothetical protein Pla133_18100 [Planctomycetes bacterium Pla133]QDV01060.1 hypothetical protein Pla86_18090 [Planctomycetes bacterium Pla86]